MGFLALLFLGMIVVVLFFLSYIYVIAALPGVLAHVVVRDSLRRYDRAKMIALPVVHALFFAPVPKTTDSELRILPIVWLGAGKPFPWTEQYGSVLFSGLAVFAISLAWHVWRSNSTPHADARNVPAPADAPGARAGGRER